MTGTEPVLVIGGGTTGVGVARDLARRGVDVTLVDRGGLGGGTSGRSHGVLHSGARYAESDAVGAEECIEENRIIRSIAAGCIRDTGGLFVRLADDDPSYFERKLEACREVGIDAERLEPAVARRTVPDLADGVEDVFRVPDAVVHPSRLVAANAADAAAHGATIHTHAPVESLTVRENRVTSAHIGGSVGETIEPAYVVNAAGPWAGRVASMAGLNVPMSPTRGVMIAVEYDRLGPVLNRCREPDDGDIVVPHETEAVLGTTSVPTSDPGDREHDDREREVCLEECSAMLPPVSEVEIRRTWTGVRPLYSPEEKRGQRGISRGFARLDHADDGVENAVSIVGGKLTTYRLMAASVADLVCDRLGVTAACTTATATLPGSDEPAQLEPYIDEFDIRAPTDGTDGQGY